MLIIGWMSKIFFELVETYCPNHNQPTVKVNTSKLEKALSLFKGTFMAGFTLDSPIFEIWMVKTRQEIDQKRVQALRCLAVTKRQLGELAAALDYAQQWIELEPWEEAGYRHSMQILLELGRRNAALTQYEICRKRLAEDLAIEPQPETVQLYEQIKGRPLPSREAKSTQLLNKKVTAPGPPPKFLRDAAAKNISSSPFFARQKELNQLNKWLKEVLGGHGRTVFIKGEPGSGKTTLLSEFANQSLAKYPDLLLLWGQCNAYTGHGDPYFPFLTMTRMLAGNVEPLVPGAVISLNHLERLWQSLPDTLKSLAYQGSGLIQRFLPEMDQFSLAGMHPGVPSGCLNSISTLLEESSQGQRRPIALNDQFLQVVSDLSKDRPILIVIDDLQWIDDGSASLLFHLGRQLAGKRILLLGAFRPVEVAVAQDDQPHPLEGILQECQAVYGDSLIDLADSEGKAFVDALLTSEPNAFTPSFHYLLHQHTSGHPLYTIELLRGMQLRNEILRDNHGKWVESDHLNWERLPSRVEAVIARRIGQLPKECQTLLDPACVQGEVFSVEVLSQVVDKPEKEIFELLSEEIAKRHQLIYAHGVQRIGERRITNFRFRHGLFQIYLYNQLNPVEKAHLHHLVGEELEKLYQNHLMTYPEMAHNLARHFELADIRRKSVFYYSQAGKFATRLTAHSEAIQNFRTALNLLEKLPPSQERDQKELDLQLNLAPPLTALKGWGAPELKIAFDRAQKLCETLDDPSKLIPALWLLATFRLGRSEHAEVDRLSAQFFELAKKLNDPALLALASLQVSPLHEGRLREARRILERAAAVADIRLQRSLAQRFGMAPAAVALGYLGNCLWMMGYPEQAIQTNQQGMVMTEAVEHPMTTCYVTSRSCWLGLLMGDPGYVDASAKKLYQVAHKYGFKNFEFGSQFLENWVNFMKGEDRIPAIEAMQKAYEAYYATKTTLNRTAFLVVFAQVCLEAGQGARGLKAIEESIDLGEETGERWFQAEAWRIKGELLLKGEEGTTLDEENRLEAKTCFRTAYKIAKQQDAKAFELRAAISLARLWNREDRSSKVREILKETLDWFTEGFDTPDLQKAQRLLDEMKENNIHG
jgi:predicted ATPase